MLWFLVPLPRFGGKFTTAERALKIFLSLRCFRVRSCGLVIDEYIGIPCFSFGDFYVLGQIKLLSMARGEQRALYLGRDVGGGLRKLCGDKAAVFV
jgi:hypothetical protein